MLIETVGRVTSLKVAEELGFVYLDDGSGMPEQFILWWKGLVDMAEVSSAKRVTGSIWVSIIRSALKRGVPIRIRHDDESSVVRAVYLDAAP